MLQETHLLSDSIDRSLNMSCQGKRNDASVCNPKVGRSVDLELVINHPYRIQVSLYAAFMQCLKKQLAT